MTDAPLQHYACENPYCDLGTRSTREKRGQHGLFTGGIARDPDTNETRPEEGFCPNCHEPGAPVDVETYEPGG